MMLFKNKMRVRYVAANVVKPLQKIFHSISIFYLPSPLTRGVWLISTWFTFGTSVNIRPTSQLWICSDARHPLSSRMYDKLCGFVCLNYRVIKVLTNTLFDSKIFYASMGNRAIVGNKSRNKFYKNRRDDRNNRCIHWNRKN